MAWLGGAASVLAQTTTPQPFLISVTPAAAQAGTQVELSVTGTDLDGATRLHFSIPGITCTPQLDAKQQPVANKFIVALPAGLAADTCDVRVVARYGISNPRGFVISALPVVQVPAKASSADTAFTTALNTTLVGVAPKQSASVIRFEAKKGQHLLAVCRPQLIDSRMDAVVSLRNAKGLKLARMKPDGLLDFTAPADGAYTLEVQDMMFRGDAEFPFVITLTTGPVVQRAFDGGAQWTLYGHHLPNGTAVVSPSSASLQRLQTTAEEARRLLAESPIRATLFGPENEAPTASPPPMALKLPARYNGWFPANGQARAFTFEAKKGEVFWIEINCASKGIAADPNFIVEKGDAFIAEAADRVAIAAKSEFDSGAADPAYRFEAKEAGTYRVKLRNLFTSAPQEPFELTLQPAGSNFELVALSIAAPKAKAATTVEVITTLLWRGGVAVMKVFARRHQGFNGPIDLSADGLPADVRFLGGSIREGQSIGYAAFFAEPTAKEWAGPLRLHGKDGAPARGATAMFKVGNTAKESTLTRLTDEVVLGVVPSEVPVSIEATSQVIESTGSDKLSIPLQVKRSPDFTEAIKLTSLGIDGLTTDIAAKATSGALAVDVAKLKLPAGDHPLLLQAVVKFKHRRNEDPKVAPKELAILVHSKPIILRVKPVVKSP